MDEQKRCPVCNTEIPADADICPVCGMDDLNRIFLDKESYDQWVETKLKPYISRYDKGVVAIAVGSSDIVGLKEDGIVVVASRFWLDDRYEGVENWRNIVAVAAGGSHIVGLRKDGTVVAVGSNYHGQCKVGSWRDIVAVAAGKNHTVGLKKDGIIIFLEQQTVDTENLWNRLSLRYRKRWAHSERNGGNTNE